MHQESGRSSAGRLGVGSLGKLQFRCGLGLWSHLKAGPGLGDLPPTWVTHMAIGKMMLVVGRKPQLLPTGASPHAA